ncbi:MAG: hypothetical protein ACK5NG_10875 [Chthoniobacterales bacterium]
MALKEPNPAHRKLVLWLRADQGISDIGDGKKVLQWENMATSSAAVGDAVSNGNDPVFMASSAIYEKVPAIYFNGSDQGMDIREADKLLSAGEVTVFIVAANGGFSGDGDADVLLAEGASILFASSNSANTARLAFQRGKKPFETLRADWDSVEAGRGYIFTLRRSGAEAGKTSLAINGTKDDDGVAIPNLTPETSATLGYQLKFESQRFWDGEIAEVLVYHTVLSPKEQRDVEKYLSRKYSIALEH